MGKFVNVDILDCLEQIVKKNTVHYQGDFEIDKDILQRYAQDDNPENKHFLWMSRSCGTHCLRERSVFIKDSAQYTTWVFYENYDSQHILAYSVEITGCENGIIRGNICPLDYKKHCTFVRQTALSLLGMDYIFTFGKYRSSDTMYMQSTVDKHYDLGDFEYAEPYTNDEESLKALLSAVRESLHYMRQGDFEKYIKRMKQMKE